MVVEALANQHISGPASSAARAFKHAKTTSCTFQGHLQTRGAQLLCLRQSFLQP